MNGDQLTMKLNKDIKEKALALPTEKQDKQKRFLKQNQHMFTKSDLESGKTYVMKLHLNKGISPSLAPKPYRTPYSQRPS